MYVCVYAYVSACMHACVGVCTCCITQKLATLYVVTEFHMYTNILISDGPRVRFLDNNLIGCNSKSPSLLWTLDSSCC